MPEAALPVPPSSTAEPSTSRPRRAGSASRPSASRAASPRRTAPLAGSRGKADKSGFSLLPSAPTIVGAAALVIAAAGAVTVNGSQDQFAASGSTKMFTPASALTGTSAGMSSAALDDRLKAVSRDSQRAALKDAANDDLQAAVEAQAEQRNAALAQLAASAEKYAGQIAANAWHLPVAPGLYHLTAGFGESSGLWANTHTGLDFAAPTGTPVMAVANATVREVGWAGPYGNRIVLVHKDGTETWYCHLSSIQVSPGQTVVGGQRIGLVGATGNVTGPHLHLEVRPGAGDPVDPYAALVAHGLTP